jgi:hypothetical protein
VSARSRPNPPASVATVPARPAAVRIFSRTGRLHPACDVLVTSAGAEPVTAVLVHHDTDLYDLKVKAGHRTAVIHTTASHLFWVTYLTKWIPAAKLRKGEPLKTANGATVTAGGGTTPKTRDGWMWDLTVPGNDDHDFYVLPTRTDCHHPYYVAAGSMPVLVHNCSPFGEDAMQQAQDYASSPDKMAHVLDPEKHNLGNLIQAAGGRSEAMQQIVGSLSDGVGLPESGPFEVTRTIQGEVVTIRGAVVNGVPKIGTAFIP